MTAERGYKGKVTLGADTVAEMGRWEWTGINNALLDSSQLGDEFDSFEYGRGNGGVVTFSGWYDPDCTHQGTLFTAAKDKTDVSTIRLYFGSGASDYFEPDTSVVCKITQCSAVSVDKDATGLAPISFTMTVSGGVLVKHT